MQWLSTGGIFYIIDNIILPLGTSIVLLFFLLFLIRIMKKDQLDIFNNPKVMNPKEAKTYIQQVKKEKIQKEFETLCKYEKLDESHKAGFVRLREDGIGIKEAIQELNPMDAGDKK